MELSGVAFRTGRNLAQECGLIVGVNDACSGAPACIGVGIGGHTEGKPQQAFRVVASMVEDSLRAVDWVPVLASLHIASVQAGFSVKTCTCTTAGATCACMFFSPVCSVAQLGDGAFPPSASSKIDNRLSFTSNLQRVPKPSLADMWRVPKGRQQRR